MGLDHTENVVQLAQLGLEDRLKELKELFENLPKEESSKKQRKEIRDLIKEATNNLEWTKPFAMKPTNYQSSESGYENESDENTDDNSDNEESGVYYENDMNMSNNYFTYADEDYINGN